METTEAETLAGEARRAPHVKRGVFLAGLFAMLLGAFVRLAPAVASGFPVNDGGLFYVFVREIQAADYRLPAYSNYNQAAIPFVYPPLSFYLTGWLSSLTDTSLLDLVRFLPPVISVLTIPAVYLLARRLTRSELSAAAAAVSFALLPTAFDFMIVGGGLPRALGFLFCLLTLHQAVGLHATGDRRLLLTTAIFASLTVLSHPVVAWFMVYSLAVLFLFQGAGKRALVNLLVVAAGTTLLTSPWWGICIARHGVGPFLAAFQAGTRSWSALLAPFLFMQTNELYLALLAVLALFGLFVSLRQKRYLLPVWLAAVFVFEPRLSATYAAIPTALLAGIGFGEFVFPGLAGVDVGQVPGAAVGPSDKPHGRTLSISGAGGWVVVLATAYLVVYLLVAAFLAAPRASLSRSQREAMQWIRSTVPAGSQFAIVSGIRLAGIDYVSEWFPALTDRVSVATPQGYEWFPGQLFDARLDLHTNLQDCGYQDVRCLEAWAVRSQSPYTHVYVVKAPPSEGAAEGTQDLYDSLLSSPDYEEIYNREDVAIFAYHPATAPSP